MLLCTGCLMFGQLATSPSVCTCYNSTFLRQRQFPIFHTLVGNDFIMATATLEHLKLKLREKSQNILSPTRPLTEWEYSDGFKIFVQGPNEFKRKDFILPQLSRLLEQIFDSHPNISVLEIGPGPDSVLGHLPWHMRRKIRRYTAYEPNGLFAKRLEARLHSLPKVESPMPCIENLPIIHRLPFELSGNEDSDTGADASAGDEKFDLILFCHSMYGMKPKTKFIERALGMLADKPGGGMVVVFHRDGSLHLDGLVCHQIATFPTGTIYVPDTMLTIFARFIAGFVVEEVGTGNIQDEWRKLCRDMSDHDSCHPGHLRFDSPEIMVAFTKSATSLSELASQVPVSTKGKDSIKNREAHFHHPAMVVRPTSISQIQQFVQWALKHDVGLSIIGGGHSGHCLWPNVVSVDMEAFDQVHISNGDSSGLYSSVVVEAGCKTGGVISKTVAAGLTVPLGSRPSVGAGLWLQGGIGHLARLHGLACDAIIGAVVVSVDSGQLFYAGDVPIQHCPSGAIRPDNNKPDLLWSIKGAGTKFFIVVSVTFRAYAARTYLSQNWTLRLKDEGKARLKLRDFDRLIARDLPNNCSADAYLYCDNEQLHLGVTKFESFIGTDLGATVPNSDHINKIMGPGSVVEPLDSIGMFDAKFRMSSMHGGHGGKTSSFKRCLFLKDIGSPHITSILVASILNRPTSVCYFHLLQGGGAVRGVPDKATAFGCRDWDFACVITGVRPRDQDGTHLARAVVKWVYKVANDLLPLSCGVYHADLGPDPRDAILAEKAFGSNQARLALVKIKTDPRNVLAYACPLPKFSIPQKVILLITGKSGVGKDHVAREWASLFTSCAQQSITARVVSISDVTKRQYALATGTDLARLNQNRAYKEKHRPALTAFFQSQLQHQPQLLQEHFLSVVDDNSDVDVLLITGMREEAPLAAFSHLVPDRRCVDIRVQASEETGRIRRGHHSREDGHNNDNSDQTTLDYCPTLIFDNDKADDHAIKVFAMIHLLWFFENDLQILNSMVRSVPHFPRPGIEFRHVLNICQYPVGLEILSNLFWGYFARDRDEVDVIVGVEAGGFVFASTLAGSNGKPLALIREGGKLPPPTVWVRKPRSHITSALWSGERVELEENVIPRGASVLVVDDVLASGKTLCAVLQLLGKAHICPKDVSVLVVAEFPIHGARKYLYEHGFGGVNVQSLLVLDGM